MKNRTIWLNTSFLVSVLFFYSTNLLKAECDSLINQVNYPLLSGFQDSLILLCEYANIPTVLTADCFYNPEPETYKETLVAYIASTPLELNGTAPFNNGYYPGLIYFDFEEIGTGLNEGFISEDFFEEIEDFYRWGSYLSPFYFLYVGYVFRDTIQNQFLTDSIYGAIPVKFDSTLPVKTRNLASYYNDCPASWLYSFKNNTLNHPCVSVDFPYQFNFYIDGVLQETHTVSSEAEDSVKTAEYNISVGEIMTFEYINEALDTFTVNKTQKLYCYDNDEFVCMDEVVKPVYIDWCAAEDTVYLPLNESPFVVDAWNQVDCDYSQIEVWVNPFLYVKNEYGHETIDRVFYDFEDQRIVNMRVLKEVLDPYINQQIHLDFEIYFYRAGPPGIDDYYYNLEVEIPIYFQNESTISFNCPDYGYWNYDVIPPSLNYLSVDIDYASCQANTENFHQYELAVNDFIIAYGEYQGINNFTFDLDELQFEDAIQFTVFDSTSTPIFRLSEQFLCNCEPPAPFITNEYSDSLIVLATQSKNFNSVYDIVNPAECCENVDYQVEWILFDVSGDFDLSHKIDLDLIGEPLHVNSNGIFLAMQDFEEHMNRWLHIGLQVSVLDNGNTTDQWVTPLSEVFFYDQPLSSNFSNECVVDTTFFTVCGTTTYENTYNETSTIEVDFESKYLFQDSLYRFTFFYETENDTVWIVDTLTSQNSFGFGPFPKDLEFQIFIEDAIGQTAFYWSNPNCSFDPNIQLPCNQPVLFNLAAIDTLNICQNNINESVELVDCYFTPTLNPWNPDNDLGIYYTIYNSTVPILNKDVQLDVADSTITILADKVIPFAQTINYADIASALNELPDDGFTYLGIQTYYNNTNINYRYNCDSISRFDYVANLNNGLYKAIPLNISPSSIVQVDCSNNRWDNSTCPSFKSEVVVAFSSEDSCFENNFSDYQFYVNNQLQDSGNWLANQNEITFNSVNIDTDGSEVKLVLLTSDSDSVEIKKTINLKTCTLENLTGNPFCFLEDPGIIDVCRSGRLLLSDVDNIYNPLPQGEAPLSPYITFNAYIGRTTEAFVLDTLFPMEGFTEHFDVWDGEPFSTKDWLTRYEETDSVYLTYGVTLHNPITRQEDRLGYFGMIPVRLLDSENVLQFFTNFRCVPNITERFDTCGVESYIPSSKIEYSIGLASGLFYDDVENPLYRLELEYTLEDAATVKIDSIVLFDEPFILTFERADFEPPFTEKNLVGNFNFTVSDSTGCTFYYAEGVNRRCYNNSTNGFFERPVIIEGFTFNTDTLFSSTQENAQLYQPDFSCLYSPYDYIQPLITLFFSENPITANTTPTGSVISTYINSGRPKNDYTFNIDEPVSSKQLADMLLLFEEQLQTHPYIYAGAIFSWTSNSDWYETIYGAIPVKRVETIILDLPETGTFNCTE